MNVRVVIADDEPLSRVAIRASLATEPDITVVGEAVDGPTAIQKVKTLLPDLLFLDIRMPGADGFEVLERLSPHHVPAVVFVTAYDQYAVKAFEVHANDYLLKPFTRKRFADALQAARREIGREGELGSHSGIIALLDERKRGAQSSGVAERGPVQAQGRIAVKHGGRVVLINIADVDWVEASANYSTLHVATRAYLLRATISQLLAKLDPRDFVRIHRSTIVNVNRMAELTPQGHGDYDVTLNDGTVLKMSRHYRPGVFT